MHILQSLLAMYLSYLCDGPYIFQSAFSYCEDKESLELKDSKTLTMQEMHSHSVQMACKINYHETAGRLRCCFQEVA